uniref:Type II inositol 3,4-bisphosphate 4-phosphatase-like n=1 Tax=Acanthochromis polyacanthus TaxID=80966 RepID=A0A3Q1EQK2_9TELE
FCVCRRISLVQEVKELGDLSPHWDGLRHDVISHCHHLIGCYQETLAELDKLSASSCFKSSSSKSDRHLQFVPTNLHSQRMEVTDPDCSGVWYDVITFGAPADHHQAFKHGGLTRLLSKHTNPRYHFRPSIQHSVIYSQDESSRARELLASVAQLQPQVFGLSEELLAVSLEVNAGRLHKSDAAFFPPDPSVCSRAQRRAGEERPVGHPRPDRVWANVAKSLNCIIAMVDRLDCPQEVTSPELLDSCCCTKIGHLCDLEQLLPLVLTLRDCVREAVTKARAAMTFVVLQGALSATITFASCSSQLSAVVFGFMLKLHESLKDPQFLLQLHSVGILVQLEGLLSTYGDELGMLEDMEQSVTDLRGAAFTVTQAKTQQPEDLLPTIRGTWFVVEVPLPPETFSSLPRELKDGCLIRVDAVLFNIGINQQQSLAERFGDVSLQDRLNQQSFERLKAYCSCLTDRLPNIACFLSDGIQSLPDLLSSLDSSLEARRRKNVEVLWIAAMVCRQVNGVRLTSCKSAKDRTAMSVTLEQCLLLQQRHKLSQQSFSSALDSMRRSRQPSGLRSPWPLQCLAPKAPRWHLYPVAFLLVTSHLLVLWLILSLVILLAKYQ